jgi:predicted glycosyltransferase
MPDDRPPTLDELTRWVREFSRARDWEQFHHPKDLAVALVCEVGEVMEHLRYRTDERIAIASVGGTGVGGHLMQKIAEAFPRMKREVPELRLVLVSGPRLQLKLPQTEGLEVRPYVHNLFEHLACADLALVQGGLATTMELVATRRPFLSFPLQNHFEQCIHVRRRLFNYEADHSVDYREITAEGLAEQAMAAMHQPVRYRPVETDGAARAARRIAEVLNNRGWAK